jgi:hypothetical protein
MRITKDFLAGALFVAIGGFAFVIAQNYRMGTAMQMGPGYFPIVLSVIIIILGCCVMAVAAMKPERSEVVATWELRPLIAVLASILAFAVLIRPWGLVASIAACVVIARIGARDRGFLEIAAVIVVLSVCSIAIFSYGLHLSLRIWPF